MSSSIPRIALIWACSITSAVVHSMIVCYWIFGSGVGVLLYGLMLPAVVGLISGALITPFTRPRLEKTRLMITLPVVHLLSLGGGILFVLGVVVRSPSIFDYQYIVYAFLLYWVLLFITAALSVVLFPLRTDGVYNCPECGYDLRGSGLDAGCPECGWNREPDSK